jgi:predicted lipoprotein with Yx(FWY)xxD motif
VNATHFSGTARGGIGSGILLLGGAAWLLLPASANAAGFDVTAFADEPVAHAAYNRMIEAMHQARSLSYTSRYEHQAEGRVLSACTYQVWLKKPNFFRMETRSSSGELGGVLVGDGTSLWIHWPKGRPQWKYVAESEADRKTRFTSYMTKPAPRGRHSIAHEAPFLGADMGYPAVLDASVFHGHVDSTERYVDAVRKAGAETIGGEDCDKIEVA